MKTATKVRVVAHAASIARLRVPFVEPLDMGPAAGYFEAQGIPPALAQVIAAEPRRGLLSTAKHHVTWIQDDDWNGVYIFIDVTIKGEARGPSYLEGGRGALLPEGRMTAP